MTCREVPRARSTTLRILSVTSSGSLTVRIRGDFEERRGRRGGLRCDAGRVELGARVLERQRRRLRETFCLKLCDRAADGRCERREGYRPFEHGDFGMRSAAKERNERRRSAPLPVLLCM